MCVKEQRASGLKKREEEKKNNFVIINIVDRNERRKEEKRRKSFGRRFWLPKIVTPFRPPNASILNVISKKGKKILEVITLQEKKERKQYKANKNISKKVK